MDTTDSDVLPAYIYVLDYSDATICKIELTEEEKHMDAQDVIEKHGCDTSTCSWMCTDKDIVVIINITNNGN